MSIADFQHPANSGFVGWTSSTGVVRKLFGSDVLALQLRHAERVLVVELAGTHSNATIYGESGEALFVVENPDPHALCFGDARYIGGELTLISRRRDASMMACVIDEDGQVLRTYETR